VRNLDWEHDLVPAGPAAGGASASDGAADRGCGHVASSSQSRPACSDCTPIGVDFASCVSTFGASLQPIFRSSRMWEGCGGTAWCTRNARICAGYLSVSPTIRGRSERRLPHAVPHTAMPGWRSQELGVRVLRIWLPQICERDEDQMAARSLTRDSRCGGRSRCDLSFSSGSGCSPQAMSQSSRLCTGSAC
jgi:hypothetical protein